MSQVLLAEFASEADFARALEAAQRQGVRVVDGFAPFLPEIARTTPDPGPMRVTAAVAVGGFAMAGLFYLLEWWTATVAYPFDIGGRPHNSWPAFIMGPFEFGVFCAGLCGFITLLIHCGLPRPHYALFEADGVERASQDRYFLALEPGEAAETLVQSLGALRVQRAEL